MKRTQRLDKNFQNELNMLHIAANLELPEDDKGCHLASVIGYEMGWTGVHEDNQNVIEMLEYNDYSDDQKEALSNEGIDQAPYLTFANLKIAKRLIFNVKGVLANNDKCGTNLEKEAILIMIKKFKAGEYGDSNV